MPEPMAVDLFQLEPARYALALFCAALIGFSKSGIAGAGTPAIPLMATLFPAGPSTGILLPILVVGDIFAVAWYRRHAVWAYVLRALPWAVIGIIAGWAFLFFFYQPAQGRAQAVCQFGARVGWRRALAQQ